MTPDARARLVEVMAEALCPRERGAKLRRVGVELEIEQAIAAAERAGFRWIAPDDGR